MSDEDKTYECDDCGHEYTQRYMHRIATPKRMMVLCEDCHARRELNRVKP